MNTLNLGANVCEIQAGRHFDFGMRNWSIIVETQTACSMNEHGRVDFFKNVRKFILLQNFVFFLFTFIYQRWSTFVSVDKGLLLSKTLQLASQKF